MNGTEKSQINLNVKRLPPVLDVTYDYIHRDSLAFPHLLFDSKIPPVNNDLFNSFAPLIIIRQNSSNRFTIIDGCKRYAYYKQEGKQIFPCQIVLTPLTDSEIGLLRIAINTERKLHVREKYWTVMWLKNNFSKTEYKSIGMEFGLSQKEIDMILELSLCTGIIREAFLKNYIDFHLVDFFTVLSEQDQICFLETFHSLGLSFQIQREFLEWLPEIACRDNETVRNIIMNSNIMKIIEKKELNSPQKIKKIRSVLFNYKYPKLSNALNSWKKLVSELNPDPSHILFFPDLNFEKDKLEIKITISNGEKAKSIFKKLSNISSRQWAQLLLP